MIITTRLGRVVTHALKLMLPYFLRHVSVIPCPSEGFNRGCLLSSRPPLVLDNVVRGDESVLRYKKCNAKCRGLKKIGHSRQTLQYYAILASIKQTTSKLNWQLQTETSFPRLSVHTHQKGSLPTMGKSHPEPLQNSMPTMFNARNGQCTPKILALIAHRGGSVSHTKHNPCFAATRLQS